MEETIEKVERRKFRPKLFNYSLWRILAYFVIYSILGFIIETIYGVIKDGVLESRQNFLYGPFCAIYGVGAIVIILSLQKFKHKYTALFLGGCIVGSVLEYVISWAGEVIFHVKWWDYSEMPLNINGRICIFYSMFWGILSLYLLISLNPNIDKLINYVKIHVNHNIIKFVVFAILIFMIFDYIITSVALKFFMIRTIVNYDIDVSNKSEIIELYNEIYSNPKRAKRINSIFTDKMIIQTFPRLKIETSDGGIIYFKDLFPNIQPYFLKVWTPNSNNGHLFPHIV